MKINLSLSSLLLSSLLLAACSGTLLESKKIDYKSASTAKSSSLEVPPDLTAPARDDRYAIPETGKGAATYSSLNEPDGARLRIGGQEVLPQADKVRVERIGSQRWLVVGGTPEQLWPILKEFWQGAGFNLVVEMPEAGVMETDWNENRANLPQDIIRSTIGKALDVLYSTGQRDKFRTRLEKGVEPGTSEIYVSHRGMVELYINEGRSETRWQPRAADPELEAEMLQRLMVRLGVGKERGKSLLAGAAPVAERATLTQAGGAQRLLVQESFDRAWRRVGLALDRVGFVVEDRDRSQGTYFVRYAAPDADIAGKKEEKGFLSRLMFWQSDAPAVKTVAAPLRIVVKADGAASAVQVLKREGGVDDSATAGKILKLLHEQLK